MTAVIRAHLMRMALEDPETSRKLSLAPTWDDCVALLVEFAIKKGFRVVQL